ncbi:HAD family phosphatase [Jatrophihabitans telluris]|uniref:HAD family phosphatase n=1 Tax=Jatrophihabitans telluris TaxID=2038343 RepID=A0ABY4QSP6_9ACTN|nr:HAD family phosphatase [Jatrophihabitans telluris]UQX86642.1 HAD family phosphatase [Jatrophihabitans telluris]
MTELQAVLWDMDGTLVDTEPYWIAAEYRLVESFGGTWNDEHAESLVGNPLLVSAAYLREHGRVDLPPEEIVDRLLDEVIQATTERIVWRPGVLRCLAELKAAAIPCAMVTMSYLNLATAVADQLPPGTFQSLVTGDQLSRGKPDPEAYLTAARRLGVDPTRCVAIEDSPAGLGSAEAAGCVVIGVPNQVRLEPAPGRILLPTLENVGVADLRGYVSERVAL